MNTVEEKREGTWVACYGEILGAFCIIVGFGLESDPHTLRYF